ncbi:MAG: Crp/Fnr family transcriptional regulator [Bdellovibrio sp.]|nr:Crp/Fnr family transcriptional regulator [Bdellovibrio sp.]
MELKNLWANISPDTKKQFESAAISITLRRGESAYRQGDLPKGIYFIEQGLVGLNLLGAASGREHLMRFFRQGQFFGHRALFSDEGYHGSAVALETTSLKLVPKEIVLAVIDKEPELLRDVVKVLSKELRRCETNQVMILENQILERTAQALIYLKDLHPDHNWTRQEIANFCASTASTVIKAMAELEDLGLIRQEGRVIHVLDRDGLIALQDRGT